MTPQFFAGNRIVLLENGAAYFPALIADIEQAQHEIHLEAYLFAPDSIGLAIAAALERAAARGVQVRLLVDGFGGRSFVRNLLGRLRSAGIDVLLFRPEIGLFSLRRNRLRRMHRKLVVIDGRVAFVGGINLIDDLSEVFSEHPRQDYAVRIEGPVLAPILASTQGLWRRVAWASLRRRPGEAFRVVADTSVRGDTLAAFVVRDNLPHRHDIEEAYLVAIHRAEREILIACAYFFPGKRFRHALIDAARRGVKVSLLLQGYSDHPVQLLATRALYPHFLLHGIRLFEYHRSLLHAKVAVIDQHWATVGSSNIDPFSLLLAREANLVIESPSFAAQLRSSLLQVRDSGARELSSTDWQLQPRLHRIASWLAYNFARFAIGVAGFRGKH